MSRAQYNNGFIFRLLSGYGLNKQNIKNNLKAMVKLVGTNVVLLRVTVMF